MTEQYYKFDVGKLPDELYRPEIPVEKWLATCESTKEATFPIDSLYCVIPITWDVELEQIVGISIYIIYGWKCISLSDIAISWALYFCSYFLFVISTSMLLSLLLLNI